ncbi:hypothetical protein [Sneathiella limimaris]|uniref:hypothetical protein n=1 Tax=Sneathiella limimaris TaxID=1964213 RepID=UPI00146F5AF2|nr:hypothetical protein [Sneathiella limimaris]
MRVLNVLFLLALIVSAGTFSAPSFVAANPKTVLILSEPNSQGSGISEILFTTVAKRISTQLEQAGYTAEQAVRGSGLTDPELLAELKAAREKGKLGRVADFVALIQITANTILEEKGARIRVEIQGRMLDVETGDRLALFELPVPQQLIAPADCNRSCILKLLQDNIESLADGLGLILGQRLNATDP